MTVPKKPPIFNLYNNSKDLQDALVLLQYQEIREYVSYINEKYYHWDELRHFTDHPHGVPVEMIWNLVKHSRLQQYREINLAGTVFRYVLTDNILSRLHRLDQSSGTIESRSESPLKEAQVEKYLLSSLMEEAIATSQLEGAVATREVAKEMLRNGKRPKNESEQMIVNAYSTMMFLKEIKDRQLTPELICQIHSKLVQNTMDDAHIGKFRDSDEIKVIDISSNEVAHTPPKHDDIPNLINALCDLINSEQKAFLHPIIKSIILHFMIGYIHPFHDGNGRTARALFYWYSLKSGYWLFEYMPISIIIKRAPGQYSHAYVYAENDYNDLTYFIIFHLDRLELALKEFRRYVAEKQKESERVKEILQHDSRLKFRQSDIILRFMKHPQKLFSIDEIKRIYNVTYETARSDLELLAKLGYCTRFKDRRKFVYRYSDRNPK